MIRKFKRLKNHFCFMAALVLMLMLPLTSQAGAWKEEAGRWKWTADDGTNPAGCWEWIDDDGDGICECYYFDQDGYCLISGRAPDGFAVNENGEWTEDGTVRCRFTFDQNENLVNHALASQVSGDPGIRLGTALETALGLFNQYKVGYSTDNNCYSWFDSSGWLHTCGFDPNGICNCYMLDIRDLTEEAADVLIQVLTESLPEDLALVKYESQSSYLCCEYALDSYSMQIEKLYDDSHGFYVQLIFYAGR